MILRGHVIMHPEASNRFFFQVAGGVSSRFFRVVVREISVFVDESGDQGGQSRFYCLHFSSTTSLIHLIPCWNAIVQA